MEYEEYDIYFSNLIHLLDYHIEIDILLISFFPLTLISIPNFLTLMISPNLSDTDISQLIWLSTFS